MDEESERVGQRSTRRYMIYGRIGFRWCGEAKDLRKCEPECFAKIATLHGKEGGLQGALPL